MGNTGSSGSIASSGPRRRGAEASAAQPPSQWRPQAELELPPFGTSRPHLSHWSLITVCCPGLFAELSRPPACEHLKGRDSAIFTATSPEFGEDWRCYLNPGRPPRISPRCQHPVTATSKQWQVVTACMGFRGDQRHGRWSSLVFEVGSLHRGQGRVERSGGNDGVGIVKANNNWNCIPAHPSE